MTKTILVSTLYPDNDGGVGYMLRAIIKLLKARDYKVRIAYYLPYSVAPNLSVPTTKLLSQRGPHIKQFSHFEDVEEYAIGAWLPELEFTHYWLNQHWKGLISETSYFLVVSGTALAALPFYMAKKRFTAWIATPYLEDRADRIKKFPWYRKVIDHFINKKVAIHIEKKILAMGNILPISQYTKDKFNQQRDVNIKSVLSIPIDTETFHPNITKVNPWQIVFTGRFNDPRKNINLLLKAISLIAQQDEPVTLILLGATPSDELNNHIERLGIADKVSFPGKIPIQALVEKLQSSDVFVLPSFQEGLCISALEGMSSGCPVISTRCGGPEEYIQDNINGKLIDFDTRQLADTIIDICSNRFKRNEMATAARQYVEDNYQLSTFETELLSTIESQS